jgi:hypothetical protein
MLTISREVPVKVGKHAWKDKPQGRSPIDFRALGNREDVQRRLLLLGK